MSREAIYGSINEKAEWRLWLSLLYHGSGGYAGTVHVDLLMHQQKRSPVSSTCPSL